MGMTDFHLPKVLLGKFEVGEEVFNVSVHEILCSLQHGPVVQRLISSNPGLNCSPAFFISLFKSILGKIFTIPFRTSNDQIASKNI